MRDSNVIAVPETVMQTPVYIKTTTRSMDTGLLILRFTVGGLLLFHGIAKLMGMIEMIKPIVVAGGLPEWTVYGLYIAEVIAPLMIILGIWTRLAAFTIIIDMIAAIILVHSHDVFTLNKGGAWGIEIEAFYFLTALVLCITGAGSYRVKKSAGKLD